MKVVLAAHGLEPSVMRLQPHRTLLEMSRQLQRRGHRVVLLSDGASALPAEGSFDGLPVRRLETVLHFRGRRGSTVARAIEEESPDVVLLHLSVAALVHQGLPSALDRPVVGLVTSPAHSASDLVRLGPGIVSSNADLIGFHLAGALAPPRAVRHAFNGGGLSLAVTLSEATRRLLVGKGAPPRSVRVAPPGVDDVWLEARPTSDDERARTRRSIGLRDDHFVACYFGSPAPTRGVLTLLRAVERAARSAPELRLLILSRRHPHEWKREASRLHRLVAAHELGTLVRVVDGVLTQPELVEHVGCSDLVCLPFELLPSDVPLSVLEAMALGRGVVTTSIASLPELVADGRGFLVAPRSVGSLAGLLLTASRDRSLAAVRGERASAYVKKHRTWDAMGQALDLALDAAIGR